MMEFKSDTHKRYGFRHGAITTIAKKVGVSRPTVYRYMIGERRFSKLSPEKIELLELHCKLERMHQKAPTATHVDSIPASTCTNLDTSEGDNHE